MAIRGSLKEASLPDVLQLLAMGLKTGCLSIAHRNNFGYIYFDRGRICYASIVNRRDRLGDALVKNGAITPEQLDAAIEAQRREPQRKLGELLMQAGALSREDLARQIRVQIEEAVYYLFTWTQGTFNFEVDVRPESEDFLVSIGPEALLLEGARRVDEWSLVEKKIPSFDVVFELDRARLETSGVALTAEQRVVVDLLDGQRDVTMIVDDSGLGEFGAGKALYGLLSAGFLHRVGHTRAVSPAVPVARVEEHRNLGIAFYRAGMLEEALREYRRVVELREDDQQARFNIGLVLLRQRDWAGAAEAFQAAAGLPEATYAVWHNLGYALERLGRFEDAARAYDQAGRGEGASDARVLTSRGAIALRAGDVTLADDLLASARPLWGRHVPSAAWYHTASLSAALRGDLARAATVLREGVEAWPHAATLQNNLAVVLERAGDLTGAFAAVERGLAEDPGIAQLQKNLGDLHYRAARYDEALDAYQRAIRIAPDLGDDIYSKLGNIRLKRREREEAVRCWERALELDPGNAIVRTNLEAVRQTL